MSNKTGFFEEALETGTTLVKQTGKAAGTAAADTTKSVVSQTGLSTGGDTTTDDFVKDLYGAGKKNPQVGSNSSSNSQATPVQDQASTDAPKTPEEQQKLQEVRSKLQKRHDEFYYEPLVNPRKDKPEERPAEKVEIEKQQEMVDLQKKEDLPAGRQGKRLPPPLVQRNQQRVEKFPGASG